MTEHRIENLDLPESTNRPDGTEGIPLDGFTLRRVVTSGTLGETELENNCFVLGDEKECVVIDASWDAAALQEAVDGRTVTALLVTHAHGDHVNAAADLLEATGAPARVHPDDAEAYRTATGRDPEGTLEEGELIAVGPLALRVLHTPGHTPGAVCLDVPEIETTFTGDTLFPGGPGKTDSEEAFAQVMHSVDMIMGLPEGRTLWPGHGEPTTIEAEKGSVEEWRERGW